jgi:intracellular multiplication protein IcmE
MTNDMNMDDFDQDSFDPSSGPVTSSEGGIKKSLTDAWRTQPLFKLMVIMVVVGGAIAAALGVFSGPPAPTATSILRTPDMNGPPGGASSPAFNREIDMANKQRVEEAIQSGGSALPTPKGDDMNLSELLNKNKRDPLAEFRAETERLKQEMIEERRQNAQQMQVMQQQIQQKPPPPQQQEDDSLAQAMQRQMQQLMETWAPHSRKVVQGTAPKDSETKTGVPPGEGSPIIQASAPKTGRSQRNIVQAGTVSYGQMLMEANSDIPGPILAQVLSGPFSGARAVGSFKTMNDYLVIQFNLINFKGKDYSVNILALDPDTTLGGMATEVDHRYFDRIILPAAAAFAAQFGSTLSQPSSTFVVTNNAVLVDQAKAGYKEALYSGLGNAAQSAAGFLQQQASQIRPLIRVETGTPLGLFFLTSVKEGDESQEAQNAAWQKAMAGMGGQAGGDGLVPVSGYAPSNAGTAGLMPQHQAYGGAYGGRSMPTTYGTAANPYATPYGNSYNMGSGGMYSNQTRLPGSSMTIITP